MNHLVTIQHDYPSSRSDGKGCRAFCNTCLWGSRWFKFAHTAQRHAERHKAAAASAGGGSTEGDGGQRTTCGQISDTADGYFTCGRSAGHDGQHWDPLIERGWTDDGGQR